MKELKLEELTTRQKLGMTMTALMTGTDEENVEYVLGLIRDHALGAVWINWPAAERNALLAKVKETADYPILIMCDAEGGMSNLRIGKHNAIGCSGRPELAYIFGKVIGVTARSLGYNAVCDPILDLCDGNFLCGQTIRSIGGDKYKVTELAKAEGNTYSTLTFFTFKRSMAAVTRAETLLA